MSHFDQIDRDPSVLQIQSALFDYVQTVGTARDQGYIDDQVKTLRSAYLAASIPAVKGYLQRLVRNGWRCLLMRRDCTHCS